MMKQLLRRLVGVQKQEPELDALLHARQQERAALGDRIDHTNAEMERVVQDGVGLEGNAEQLNRERYRALSSQVSSDRRRFAMLTNSIAQLQTLRDMDNEFRQVEALERDARACGDLEALERRQDIIELRTEELNRRTGQLAELQARREQMNVGDGSLDDEYARRFAAARAARDKAAPVTISGTPAPPVPCDDPRGERPNPVPALQPDLTL